MDAGEFSTHIMIVTSSLPSPYRLHYLHHHENAKRGFGHSEHSLSFAHLLSCVAQALFFFSF